MSGLEVWFRNDIINALNVARVAGQEAIGAAGYRIPERATIQAGDMLDMEAYWRGYEAALRTMTAAFGIQADDIDRLR